MFFRLYLDGNPIGDGGAKALMRLAVGIGGRIKVTADRCNISIVDSSAWFDLSKPLQKYQLDLESHYERAIALQLLHIVACHQSYVFRYYNYDASPPARKDPKWLDIDMKSSGRSVDLIQIKAASNEDLWDDYEKDTVAKLRNLIRAASDIYLAAKLFQEVIIFMNLNCFLFMHA
jgi:hypothetical protein